MPSRMSSTIRNLWKRMKSKEYRDSFVASHVSNTVAAQIFTMREDRKWTQTALAQKAGMRQSRISALEDPDFENVELATLRRVASAFDVGLSVRFVPFSDIAVQAGNMGSEYICVADFAHDALPSYGQEFRYDVEFSDSATTSPNIYLSSPRVSEPLITMLASVDFCAYEKTTDSYEVATDYTFQNHPIHNGGSPCYSPPQLAASSARH